MDSLLRNDTFELTHLPEGRKVVGGRWVYTVKLGPNNEEQFKARYVAKGYSQVHDIRYHFVRNEVQNGSVELQFVPSENNNCRHVYQESQDYVEH